MYANEYEYKRSLINKGLEVAASQGDWRQYDHLMEQLRKLEELHALHNNSGNTTNSGK